MTEDETNKETSEETPEDAAPDDSGADAAAGGPVVEDDSSSSQAAGEEPSSTPPADEAPEAETSEAEASEVAPESEQAEDEAPAEGEDAEASDAVAEQDDKGGQGDGAPAEDSGSEAEQSSGKKKDVIPGADLEPIALEQSDDRPLSAEERARREAEEEERAKREAQLTGEGSDDDEDAASPAPAKLESGSRFSATGKRKRSIARVILLPGSGKIEINKRELEEFFPRPLHQTMARQPLTTTGYEGSVDVRIRVHGGGIGGQAGAVRHGIARALTEIDPELRGELKRRGFLTRDARVKERRKAGLKKARKKPQFSKR